MYKQQECKVHDTSTSETVRNSTTFETILHYVRLRLEVTVYCSLIIHCAPNGFIMLSFKSTGNMPAFLLSCWQICSAYHS